MAHRGRLNVLAQVLGKPHRVIFHEFKGGSASPDEVEGSGDVKYHLGASSDREFDGNKVHLSLTANPSHLEIVDPVVLGKARAKQDQHADQPRGDIVPLEQRARVLPLLLHGDAAFAGQGVVAECFGLSGLRGHRTAGSVHFIINNQIGFTTNPRFARSSPYPSDIAKMVEAPILHANGDDPEAVVYAAKIATEFRQKFHKPVVVDMFCYRRFGHNEGDEPSFTQPLMYKAIAEHPTTLEIYGKKLVAEGLVTAGRDRRGEGRLARAGSRPSSRPARTTAPTRPTGSTASGRASRSPTPATRRGAATPASTLAKLKAIGKTAHRRSGRLQPPPDHPPFRRRAAEGDRDRRRHQLGDRRGAGLRLADRRGPSGPPVRPGRRARHLLAAPLGALRSGDRGALHPAQRACRGRRPASRSSTRCCRRRRCSASSTATRWPSRTR